MNALEKTYYDTSFERQIHSFSKGKIIPQNDQSIWLVCQGLVKLSTVCENGKEVLVGFAGSQMPFGTSLTTLNTYLATVLSKSAKLVCIALSEWTDEPHLAQALLPKIIRRLQQTESFLAIYGQQRVPDRLQNLLLLLKQEFGQPVVQGTRLSIRLTHSDLAKACGTTRVTMTRMLGKLQEEGKITFDRKNHIILISGAIASANTVNELLVAGKPIDLPLSRR